MKRFRSREKDETQKKKKITKKQNRKIEIRVTE